MVNYPNIILSLSALVAIVTFLMNYKQRRGREIFNFYEKTQQIRDDLIKFKGNREKILKKSLNLHETIAYAILKGTINEKDAYNLLKSNFIFFYEHANLNGINVKKYEYFNKLVRRWSYWGLSLFLIKKIIYFLLIFSLIILIIWLNL